MFLCHGGDLSPAFLRNLHTIFFPTGAAPVLQSHQQCARVPFSTHPCQHLLSVDFLTVATLTGVRWYLFVVLICTFLMISDVEHFSYVCWPSVCLHWRNVFSCSLPIFDQIVYFFVLELYEFLICFWISSP